MITRNQIIYEAKKWLNTPFHHQASSKNLGCDCIGLIIGVAAELGIGFFHNLLPQNYDYFQDRSYLIHCLKSYLKPGIRQLGSIALIGAEHIGWHMGFINREHENKFTWIHSCMKQGKVIEQRFFEGAFYFDFLNIE